MTGAPIELGSILSTPRNHCLSTNLLCAVCFVDQRMANVTLLMGLYCNESAHLFAPLNIFE